MKQVTIAEFKSQFDELVQQVFSGEEVEVQDNGHSFRMVPNIEAKPRRKAGSMKGLIVYMADDFDAPLEDFKEYM